VSDLYIRPSRTTKTMQMAPVQWPQRSPLRASLSPWPSAEDCARDTGKGRAQQNDTTNPARRRPQLLYMFLRYAWISPYMTSTSAEPTVRRALALAPLKSAPMPSSEAIFEKQCIVPLYIHSSCGFSDCI